MVDTKLFDLTGKVVVMTGASKGMGAAMAEALAEHGAKVMISSRKLDQVEATAAGINEKIGATRVHAMACNAGYKDQLQALVDGTRAKLGPIDVAIGNAGVNPHYGPMSQVPDDAYDKTMTTNVKSNHWLAQMVAPDMIEKGNGSIIITSSIGAFKPNTDLAVYAVSKLAVLGVMRNVAAELGPKGVRCNAICPGLIKTEFAKALWENPAAEKRVTEDTPLRRLGEPDDFKGLAVFLASDASGYITGQALTACGGISMWS